MRLGMFDDSSRPQRVPGRWLSFYLLGRRVAHWGTRAPHVTDDGAEGCWCHPEVVPVGDHAQIIVHEKGPEA